MIITIFSPEIVFISNLNVLSFLVSRSAVHTVGIWKTCVTYIEYEPYSKTWLRRDGACWATSRESFVITHTVHTHFKLF